jgi:hypothetical protein
MISTILEIFIRIKKITATRMPHRGIRTVPIASVPAAAPHRSAARQPAAGLLSSPISSAATGNWNPEKKEKTKQNKRKYSGWGSFLKHEIHKKKMNNRDKMAISESLILSPILTRHR